MVRVINSARSPHVDVPALLMHVQSCAVAPLQHELRHTAAVVGQWSRGSCVQPKPHGFSRLVLCGDEAASGTASPWKESFYMLSCQPRCLCLGDTRSGCAAKAGQVAMSDAQMRQDDDLRHTLSSRPKWWLPRT